MYLEVIGRPSLSGLRSAIVDVDAWDRLSTCPICGGENCPQVSRVEGVSLGAVSSVCLDCRYGYLSRRPSRAWIHDFYQHSWDQTGRERCCEDRAAARVAPDPRAWDFCREALPEQATILDVGAGFGALLQSFRSAGHEVRAIETSRHRAKFVQSRLGIRCVDASERIDELDPPFSLICLQHVLEHLFDPVDSLIELRRRLADGGLLYLAVPDFWQEYPPQSFHFVPHLSWFTEQALDRLLRMTGFEVIRRRRETEITWLARKAKPQSTALKSAGEADRSEFWGRLTQFVHEAFGGDDGCHLLIWYEDAGSPWFHYNRRALPGWTPAGGMVKGGIRLLRRLPGRLRQPLVARLPAWLRGNPRMLRVRLTANGGNLPLRLSYPGQSPPVWVK